MDRLVLGTAGILIAAYSIVLAAVEDVSALVAALGAVIGLVLLLCAGIWGRRLLRAFQALDERVGQLEAAVRAREG